MNYPESVELDRAEYAQTLERGHAFIRLNGRDVTQQEIILQREIIAALDAAIAAEKAYALGPVDSYLSHRTIAARVTTAR
jgi:hypothetical protein